MSGYIPVELQRQVKNHFVFTTAIYPGLDPINRAVCLAAAVAGPHFWPEIFPGLLEAVNKEWNTCVRQEKSKENWGQHEPPGSQISDSEAVRSSTFEQLYKRTWQTGSANNRIFDPGDCGNSAVSGFIPGRKLMKTNPKTEAACCIC